ncbi:uncharacterized protein Bfra_007549 [Botrytis fragariae]|uniref:Uncharacterized protein n=1 Tax=Botrytis fragariae TaxID=1964551 RepID=A0A8H6EDP2_9HELO|nr:uncharacterized protein Bfra_007549 [Botrytis fragariae]KAF5868351.1 hypothetical protein Bfra_007549 [Botrytis fragariae]
MYSHNTIAFTGLLTSMFQIIVGLVLPEAYPSFQPPALIPRQEGYRWCPTEHPGTCTIAYIIDSTKPHPISIQITDNNCDDALGGARNLDIGSTLADIETDSRRTDPVTKLTIQRVVNGMPKMTADGKELSWHPPARADARTIHIAPFDCHMR